MLSAKWRPFCPGGNGLKTFMKEEFICSLLTHAAVILRLWYYPCLDYGIFIGVELQLNWINFQYEDQIATAFKKEVLC